MKNKRNVPQFLGWLITVMIPPIILMIAVRLLITPVFAQFEYRLPGFPEDPYGFSLQDRLRWSEPSIGYLVNSEPISYLENLQFESGDPLFNQRELSHMKDVKDVVSGMRVALAVVIVLLLALTVLVAIFQKHEILFLAYRRGGQGVIWMIGFILAFVAISFNDLFSWFHKLFFESGTWQFYTSDSLIRLFPLRFWQDAFIFVGVISLIFGVLVIVFSSRALKRTRKKSDQFDRSF